MTRTAASAKDDVVKAGGAPRAGAPRAALGLIGAQNLSLLAALAAVMALFGILEPAYLEWSNISTIGETVTVVGLLAVAETIVIICGALDISVGSQTGLMSVVSAMVFTSTGGNPVLGIGAAIAAGIGCGVVNGLIIVYGRVNAVIATLATLAAYKGIAQLISNGRAQGYVGTDDIFIFIARGKILFIPVQVWILVVAAAGVLVLLRYTDIGRNVYAIGGNDTAARLAGININKYLISVYALAGIGAAVAGIILTARTGSGQPTSGSEGLELQAITAAALGGCALKGGKGGVIGTMLAVLLLGALQNGLTVIGVNTFWQNVAQGGLLVLAVIIQQRRTGERAVGLPA